MLSLHTRFRQKCPPFTEEPIPLSIMPPDYLQSLVDKESALLAKEQDLSSKLEELEGEGDKEEAAILSPKKSNAPATLREAEEENEEVAGTNSAPSFWARCCPCLGGKRPHDDGDDDAEDLRLLANEEVEEDADDDVDNVAKVDESKE